MNPDINWNQIETVLLDMDGTILDLGFDNFFWMEYIPQAFAEKENITLEQSKTFLYENFNRIKGTLNWYCLDYWSKQLGLDVPQLKHSVGDRVAFRPGAIEFLSFLKANDKRVYLVTNAHPKSLEIKLLNVSFHQYFDELSCSHEFGYPKETQEYWRALQKKYQFTPRSSLFIDDSLPILHSAQTYGIGHVYGVAQPDLSKGIIDTKPFSAIHDFEKII